jgi:uncharacterized damage-inducible protein DinB
VAAAAHLTAEEFTRDLGASFGSVRGTLIHIMWGEKRWLQRWLDGSRLRDLSPDEFPDCSSLREGWAELDDDRRAFAAQLTDAVLKESMSIRGQTFTLAELIKHIGNHSTYHRGQIVLLLRQLGQTPPATDYAFYLIESRAPAA